MRMYDIEISLNDSDVWIVQNDTAGETVVIALHPDQIPMVCEWLTKAAADLNATDEMQRLED